MEDAGFVFACDFGFDFDFGFAADFAFAAAGGFCEGAEPLGRLFGVGEDGGVGVEASSMPKTSLISMSEEDESAEIPSETPETTLSMSSTSFTPRSLKRRSGLRSRRAPMP